MHLRAPQGAGILVVTVAGLLSARLGHPATQPLPDLVVRFEKVAASARLRPDRFFEFGIRVKNRGDAATEQCVDLKGEFPVLHFSLSSVYPPLTDSTCPNRPCVFNGNGIRDGYTGFVCSLRALAPQEELGFHVRLYTREARTGGTSMIATGDPYNRIRESSERNTVTLPIVINR